MNFRSIEELSRSDRQPDSMEVEQQRNPHMAKVMSLIRSSRESANFSSRHSPQSLRGVSPSSSSINSLHRLAMGETNTGNQLSSISHLSVSLAMGLHVRTTGGSTRVSSYWGLLRVHTHDLFLVH